MLVVFLMPYGHESEWAQGVGAGQETWRLVHGVTAKSDTTEAKADWTDVTGFFWNPAKVAVVILIFKLYAMIDPIIQLL